MKAAAATNSVIWIQARVPHRCDECDAEILPGDRMAVWYEVCHEGIFKKYHLKRRYCERDGHFLKDSLTTTEAL
jgi:hypothetical protein